MRQDALGSTIASRSDLEHLATRLLPFKQWGGARTGAGRKPKGEVAGVSHAPGAKLAARFPVHATVRLSRGLPRLRRRSEYAALRAAFAAIVAVTTYLILDIDHPAHGLISLDRANDLLDQLAASWR
jgi:hypothetical protein